MVYGKNISIIYDNLSKVDIEFYSVNNLDSIYQKTKLKIISNFGEKNRLNYILEKDFRVPANFKANSRKTVWVTGENIRFYPGIFDLYLSFDCEDVSARNIFFPFWYHCFRWTDDDRPNLDLPRLEKLTQSRNISPREVKACIFSSHPDPRRDLVVEKLQTLIPVDRFGHYYGNYAFDKFAISKNYSYQICLENDLFPNYVTEKLIEAWYRGNVPIWSGLDSLNYFNSKAIIDVSNLSSEGILEKLRPISEDSYLEFARQPILKKAPEIKNIVDKIGNILNL